MFGWLKKTAKNADETMDQVKKDLSETSEKMQTVLDEGGESVKVIAKILAIAMVVNIVSNTVGIIVSLSKHKHQKVPTIVIQNLYLK